MQQSSGFTSSVESNVQCSKCVVSLKILCTIAEIFSLDHTVIMGWQMRMDGIRKQTTWLVRSKHSAWLLDTFSHKAMLSVSNSYIYSSPTPRVQDHRELARNMKTNISGEMIHHRILKIAKYFQNRNPIQCSSSVKILFDLWYHQTSNQLAGLFIFVSLQTWFQH